MIRFAPIAVVLALLLLSPAIACAEDAADSGAEVAAQTTPAEPEYRCEYKLEECLNWMAKHYGERGWAGMNLNVENYRYEVIGVAAGSPAEQAGIRPGDLLVAVNGVEIAEQNEEKLLKIRETMKPGAPFTYTIKREGRRRNVECVLVRMPLDVAAEQIGRHLLIGHLPADLAYGEDE